MTSGPSSALVGLALLASRVACVIVIASFAVFVVDQTSNASTHQQNELSGGAQPASTAPHISHESTVHRTLDEAWEGLTSPFAGVVSGWHSEWASRGVRTLIALLVYGVGVGFLVRFIRLRT